MDNRVLCCLSVSFLLGIVFGKYQTPFMPAVFLVFLSCLAIVTARAQERAFRAAIARGAFCILAFGMGFCRFQQESQMQDRLTQALAEGDSIAAQGEVKSKEEKERQCVYYLKDAYALVDGVQYVSHGAIVYSSDLHIQVGDSIRVSGEYAPFQVSRNQGNFNEKQYYQSKKIGFRLYASKEAVVFRGKDSYAALLGKLRQTFREVYACCLPGQEAGILSAMALGDKTMLGKEIKELYQAAGISHILAISGLHVSLFGMGMFGLLRRLRCPDKGSAPLSMWMVWSFGALTGMEASTVRAACMFCFFMAARILGRSYDIVTALGFSAIVQAWENPFVLEYAGFQFSYGAVLGVAVAADILKSVVKGEKGTGAKRGAGTFGQTIYASTCIQVTTLPLSLYYYYEVPCYGILANAVALPMVGWTLPLAVFGAAAGYISLPVGRLILAPVGWTLKAIAFTCRTCVNLPGAVFVAGKPELALVVCYYIVLGAALCLVWRGAGKKWAAFIPIAIGLVLCLRESPKFEIHVLDVGQGDGIFIQTGQGEHFFVDGGSSDVQQAGTYRILPFLKSKKITSIKGWVVSHADQDHINGLEELLDSGYPIEFLVVAKGMEKDQASKRLLGLAKKAGCKVLYVAPGEKFGFQDTVFTVFHPNGKEGSRNGASLVVSLEHRGFRGFFAGDIGEKEERELAGNPVLQRWAAECGGEGIDFYKASHHGSNGSNSQELLNLLSPKLTVVSCGEGNPYGHPGQEALGRIRESGSHVFCTMDYGQVTIQFREGEVWVKAYL